MNVRDLLVKTTGAAAIALLGACFAGSAEAAPVTYNFVGNCEDCAAAAETASYAVTARLVLDGYTEGTNITEEDFVSFSYDGSNLLDPYEVTNVALTADDVWFHSLNWIGGTITTGGLQWLYLGFGDGLEFNLDVLGNFFTCGAQGDDYYAISCSEYNNDDFGTGNFQKRPTSVPEPATFAVVALGLAGLAVRRFRK